MKHFLNCSCDKCRARRRCPSPQAQQGGYLMQQILGAGQAHLRCQRFCLCVDGLPCSATPPYQLIAICVAGDGCRADADSGCRRPGCVTVTARIPLICQVRDCAGCVYEAPSAIDVPVCLRMHRDGCDCLARQFAVSAQIRLAAACIPIENNRADAPLDGRVDVWAIACKAVYAACPPQCPPSPPLYPQPCRVDGCRDDRHAGYGWDDNDGRCCDGPPHCPPRPWPRSQFERPCQPCPPPCPTPR